MKAICWHGTNDVRCDNVPDPVIADPTDCIIQITSTAICGSDLHLLDGMMPTMQEGDVLGHEPMGVVVEVGDAVKNLKKGNKVRITGLGIMQVRHRPARMGRNPATGEPIKIKASKKVAFRVAKDLKEAV